MEWSSAILISRPRPSTDVQRIQSTFGSCRRRRRLAGRLWGATYCTTNTVPYVTWSMDGQGMDVEILEKRRERQPRKKFWTPATPGTASLCPPRYLSWRTLRLHLDT
jgi:hypothetical protein